MRTRELAPLFSTILWSDRNSMFSESPIREQAPLFSAGKSLLGCFFQPVHDGEADSLFGHFLGVDYLDPFLVAFSEEGE